jgi:hypothetical protein
MNATPFIIGAYAAFAGIALFLSVGAQLRLTRARKKLAAIDPRERGA